MSSLWSEFDFWLGPDVPQRNDIALKCDHIPLRYLGLSTRTLNALLRCNIKMTVGELIRFKRAFVGIENFRPTAFNELDAKISQLLNANTKNISTLFPALNDKLSALLNSQNLFASPVKAFPEYIQSLPIDHLHLEKKVHDALISAQITTIGELDSASSSVIRTIRSFDAGSLEHINHALIMLHNSITEENIINWFFYWKCQDIQLILPIYSSATSPEEVFKDLSFIIEEVLRREFNERAGIIIKHRFGLGNEAKWTLEDIGNAFGGISRERVRQIEEQSLKVLQTIFVKQQYGGRFYQIHPCVHSIIETIQENIESLPNKIALETQLQGNLSQNLHIDVAKYRVQLALILLLIGARRIEFNYPNSVPVWGYIEPNLLLRLEKWIKCLDKLLTQETPYPLSELKILANLNKKVKKPDTLQLPQLREIIDLCNTVERLEDGSVCGKFEFLKGRGNQVERILANAGHPMDAAEIVREINHCLVPLGHRQLTEANLINQITNDDRFVPIGRSGQWGLKSWDIDTKSILKLMEQYLIIHNKPATADEIYSYVSERRPASMGSIITYLGGEKELFVRVDLTRWGLVKWSTTINPDDWTCEKMADFVATIFKEKKTKELDYRIIKDALIKETGLTERQIRGLLIHNPVIKTQKGKKWGERVALFQPNYKNILAQAKKNKPHRDKGALQKVETCVHTILNASVNKEMPMAELVVQLQKHFNYSETTLYQYLQQMNSIERVSIPNSRKKICRIKEVIENNSYIGTLHERVNRRVYAILESIPSKQILLDDLIKRLLKEFECPKPTLYRYIAELDYLERLDLPNSRKKICRLKSAPISPIVTDNIQKTIDDLITQLRNLPTGDGKAYEKLVKKFLEFAFHEEFGFTPFEVQEQVATYNGKRIRDFIIDNRDSRVEFWKDLKHVRKLEKILFDAKNYKDALVYSEIDSTLRYLEMNKAFGNFIIIISRKGIKDYEEFIEAYSSNDRIILSLDDEELITLINLKRKGVSPSTLIDQKYHEFLSRT